MKNRNLTHSDNWATPKALYDKLNKEFAFDFDPCPLCEEPIEVGSDKDGIFKEWGKSNFVNPPYSRMLKEAFIIKAVEDSMIVIFGAAEKNNLLSQADVIGSLRCCTCGKEFKEKDDFILHLNIGNCEEQ